MTKLPWTPWHKVVTLREDIKTGELALNEFAADLYDVVMKRGTRRIYEDPAEFFALTFPTLALRELAKDVVQRLAAKNQKAVRQLETTYGGGKTHALITLFHLVNDPARLPDLQSVREFRAHVGIDAPATQVAMLPFDKFDVEKGIEVRSPEGNVRMLRQPWSALAWQLGGADGLRMLHRDSKDEERTSPPAENTLADLLKMPLTRGKSTLLLIDEVLMFARVAVDVDGGWRERLKNFFQYLTQAATKVDRCCIVASLLATDPDRSDSVGKEITGELYDIFRREREAGVEPVGKKDVAEVLRRRFFTPESLENPAKFRSHVINALKGVIDLDDETKKSQKDAEERFLASYPFHPDLTEVLYSKWTQLQGFQRTRGVLRTFAQALRDAERWGDWSPLVGPSVFLGPADGDVVSQAARELTQVATVEVYEGKRQEWTAILAGELDKAQRVQTDYTSLKHREVEQAVIATFLHSQPSGQKAQLRELLVLVGTTRPDKIELRKALCGWFDTSWFLDETVSAGGVDDAGLKPPPSVWRLGSTPNLKQMHADAKTRVSEELAEDRLLEEIRRTKSLTATATQAGARVHNLPEKPALVEDDGQFRFVVLGPAAASESGKPSPEARRFIQETTASDRPRKERNAIVLAVPSRDGIMAARTAVRDHLAWLGVGDTLTSGGHKLDAIRHQNLLSYTAAALGRVTDTIQQAYCIVVTVSENDEIQAFKLQPPSGPLFSAIKADNRSRIEETAISADALLPGGPYQLWREGEDSRWAKDLIGAFARFPHLPKMLRRDAIVETIAHGCSEGFYVARLLRPDKSLRTWWRQTIEADALEDPRLELVLPDKAELAGISADLVCPGAIDDLWPVGVSAPVTVGTVRQFFDGRHTMRVSRGGYDEPVPVPKADSTVVDEAIRSSVGDGRLWLSNGPASLFEEDVPIGLVTDSAELRRPPAPLSPLSLLPEQLPEAWRDGCIDGWSLTAALSDETGPALPWKTVAAALDSAFRAGLLERTPDSGPWPCDYAGAKSLKVSMVRRSPQSRESVKQEPEVVSLRADQLQDLVDVLPELLKVTAGHELRFRVTVEISGKKVPDAVVTSAVNAMLDKIEPGLKTR
ncbi:MAG: DUF499 domain-containing protein [Acidobacteria bacterium]|nr:DUF499 domain-containing protein [Acidobacteriota bacterium]